MRTPGRTPGTTAEQRRQLPENYGKLWKKMGKDGKRWEKMKISFRKNGGRIDSVHAVISQKKNVAGRGEMVETPPGQG